MHTRKQQNAVFASLYAVLPLVGFASILAASSALTGCRSATPSGPATIIDNNPGTDPSDANLAPANSQPAPSSSAAPRTEKVRTLGAQQSYTPQQTSEQYPQQQGPPDSQYSSQANNGYDTGEAAGYDALADASQPPPPLPEYEQPPVPEPNDLWTPGYWNYAPQGYYWVPGAWVAPPYVGALWTPAYWGYDGGHYRLHRGFWANHIGFYGGINYGFGYTGTGYRGGYWNGNNFYYNRAVNHVNITNIHNVYERNITINNITRVSYNGGNGGIQARPGPQELAVLHEQRTPPMATQVQLREASAQNRQQFFNENHGRPAETFTARPIAAERGIQPLPAQPFQQQGQHPQPLNQALNQQRLNEEQHQAVPTQNRFQPQAPQPHPAQEQPRVNPSTARQEPPSNPQQHPQPSPQQVQQQNAAQQQQRLQQQQAEQQQRVQQQQRATQQQTEQQRNLQQRAAQPQPQSQPHPEPQSRPQQPQPQTQPHPQPQAQPRPQPQAPSHPQPHAEAPKAEPPHAGRPER